MMNYEAVIANPNKAARQLEILKEFREILNQQIKELESSLADNDAIASEDLESEDFLE